MSEEKNEQQGTDIVEQGSTISERFLGMVQKEFSSALSQDVNFSAYQKKLASNLFIKIDASLSEFEARRQNDNNNKPPVVWNNVNLNKLALDAVHRINLGLDALIPNHIHSIPYLNGATGQYDLNLQPGYTGKDYYRREMALDKPKDIRYELVYKTDHFKELKKDKDREIEAYEFDVEKPFDRGPIIGGFGYIMFDDPTKNKLVVVPESHFQKVMNKAKTQKFWVEWPDEMRMKTLVHRTTEKLRIDPKKVNSSYHYVEAQDKVEAFDEEIDSNRLIDIGKAKQPDEKPSKRKQMMKEITQRMKTLHTKDWLDELKKAQKEVNPDVNRMLDMSDEELLELYDNVLTTVDADTEDSEDDEGSGMESPEGIRSGVPKE